MSRTLFFTQAIVNPVLGGVGKELGKLRGTVRLSGCRVFATKQPVRLNCRVEPFP